MKVSDILSLKGAATFTIPPSASIADLSKLLKERRIGAAVVSADGQSIDGVISERDIAYGLSAHNGALHAMNVSALMTKTVITCTPDDTVAFVASTMLSRNVRHLPVEEDNRIVGMVSIRDVLSWRVDELQQQTAQLRTMVNQKDPVLQDRE